MKISYRRILVLLDGSELAEMVLPYLRELGEKMGSEMDLVSVCEPSRGLERLFGPYLEKLASQLGGLTVRSLVLFGDPVEQILDYAERNNFSLIAMATHGRSGISRWDLGSVAEKVLHEAKLPVLLVSAREKAVPEKVSFRRILLPLDGSKLGEAAMPWAEEMAARVKAELLLLRVERTAPQLAWAAEIALYQRDDRAILEAEAKAYLSRVAADLKQKGIPVSYRVLFGLPAEGIVDYARDNAVDLIAMSTHGRAGLGRWVFGSVAHKVIQAAGVPVLLVRGDGVSP